MTALFAQRLNSLRGEAAKCQHGEDHYESIDPLQRKAASSSSQPPAPALPEVRSQRRWERREGALSHSFTPSPRCSGLCWRGLELHINTDKAQQRAFRGFRRPGATAQEVMSPVSVTEINEWEWRPKLCSHHGKMKRDGAGRGRAAAETSASKSHRLLGNNCSVKPLLTVSGYEDQHHESEAEAINIPISE